MNSSRSRHYNEANLADHIRQGTAAFEAGEFERALSHFKRSVEEDQNNASLWNDLGQAYRAVNRLGDAAVCYNRAATIDPSLAEPLNNLGVLSRLAGELDAAERYYKDALLRRHEYPEAYYNLALVMEERDDAISAERYYLDALSLRPDYLKALNNLGVLMISNGRLDEAESILREALRTHARSPELFTSLGTCLRQKGELRAAKDAYHKALEIKPQFGEAAWNLALVELAVGNFCHGWKHYRFRPSVEREVYPLPEAILEQDLIGKSFYIHGEQGLGDELFFLRFLTLLTARGAQVQYHPDPRIEGMCTRAMRGHLATEISDDNVNLTIADLPFLLNCDEPLLSINVQPLEANLKAMKSALAAAGPQPHLGLTYRAGTKQMGAQYKEAPLKELTNVCFEFPGTILNLQRETAADENQLIEKLFEGRVRNFTPYNDDLEDMLALMTLLDEYIGVSNTNMHLRAAAGKRARVLIPHPAEYRWMAAGDTSPWFPDFDLYRQLPDQSWEAAFIRLKSDLKVAHG